MDRLNWGRFPPPIVASLRRSLDEASYADLAGWPWFGVRQVQPWHDRWVERRIRSGNPLPLACHSRPSRFWRGLSEPLRTLQRLLWLHQAVEPQECWRSWLEEGLLEEHQGQWRSRVQIAAFPRVGSRRVAYVMSSVPHRAPGEFVYLGDDTGLLLDSLGDLEARGEQLLDICCGGGALSLGLVDRFERTLGVDLNPTAVALASSNASLNGVAGMSYLISDLWESVQGRFDWVVGNPPALPLVSPDALFAYGGAISTDLTGRLLRGLPDFLAPGGQALLLTFSPGPGLWELANSSLPKSFSLDYRIRARFRLRHDRLALLDHVFLHVRHDGKGERRLHTLSWADRLRGWILPWIEPEDTVSRLP